MNTKEYIEYLKGLSQKELMSECIRLKRSYDFSCENWIMVEELRNKLESNFAHLSLKFVELYNDFKKEEKRLIDEYNKMVYNQEERRKNLR